MTLGFLVVSIFCMFTTAAAINVKDLLCLSPKPKNNALERGVK